MTFPEWVTDLENRFDARAKEILEVDLARFRVALDKVKADVRVLHQH